MQRTQRLRLLEQLVDGYTGSLETPWGEQVRRRVSGAVRRAAREYYGSSEASEPSEVMGFLRDHIFDEADVMGKRACIEALEKVCGESCSHRDLREAIAGDTVSVGALKKYVSYKEPRSYPLIALVHRGLSSLSTANAVDFSTIADDADDQKRRVVCPGLLHQWILTELKVDLTKSETYAVLRGINTVVDRADDGPDVDEAAFNAFVQGDPPVDEELASQTMDPVVDLQISWSRDEEIRLRAQGYVQVQDASGRPIDFCVSSSQKKKNGNPITLGGATRNLLSAARFQKKTTTTSGEKKKDKKEETKADEEKKKPNDEDPPPAVLLWMLRAKAKTSRLPAIVDVVIAGTATNSNLAIAGYTCVGPRNLVRRTFAAPRYLWFARSRDPNFSEERDALIDIKATMGRSKDVHDAIFLPPDVGKKTKDTKYARASGIVEGRKRDFALWKRPRELPRGPAPVARFATWSPTRRRKECDIAFVRAVRAHAPPTATGAPDVAKLFGRHAVPHNDWVGGRLSKRGFAALLKDVGFNLAAPDRDLVLRRIATTHLDKDSIGLDDFLKFTALTDDDLDELSEHFKRQVRRAWGDDDSRLGELTRAVARLDNLCGSANLTIAEFAGLLKRSIAAFPTEGEVVRLAARWAPDALDGEVSGTKLGEFLVAESVAARRSAARVAQNAAALRRLVVDAVKKSDDDDDQSAAWATLRKRRLRRLRGVTAYKGTTKEPVEKRESSRSALGTDVLDILEVEDLAITLEHAGVSPRLSPAEYAKLASLVAPLDNRISRSNFHVFAARPLRPVAEVARLVNALAPTGDTVPAYRQYFFAQTSADKARIYEDRVAQALGNLKLLDADGHPKLVDVSELREACIRQASEEELEDLTLAEWANLAQHVDAAVFGDDAPLKVHPKRFLDGLARQLIGDAEKKVVERRHDKDEDELEVARRDLRREILTAASIGWSAPPAADYGAWLGRALSSYGLPTVVPAPLGVVERLIRRYDAEFAWDLDDDALDRLARDLDADADGLVSALDLRRFVDDNVEKKTTTTKKKKDDGTAVVTDLRDGLNAEGRTVNELQRALTKYDTNKSGMLPVDRILEACASFGKILPRPDLAGRALAANFADSRGLVDIVALIDAINLAVSRSSSGSGGKKTGRLSAITAAKVALVRKSLRKDRLFQTLRRFDANRDGRADLAEVQEGLTAAGICGRDDDDGDLNRDDVAQLFHCSESHGTVHIGDFVDVLAGDTEDKKKGPVDEGAVVALPPPPPRQDIFTEAKRAVERADAGSDLRQSLRRYASGSGAMGRREFDRLLREAGVKAHMSRRDFDDLLAKLESREPNIIDADLFVAGVLGSDDDDKLGGVLQEVFEAATKAAAMNHTAFHDFFAPYDPRGTGVVPKTVFSAVLTNALHCRLTDRNFASLLRLLDAHNDLIDYNRLYDLLIDHGRPSSHWSYPHHHHRPSSRGGPRSPLARGAPFNFHDDGRPGITSGAMTTVMDGTIESDDDFYDDDGFRGDSRRYGGPRSRGPRDGRRYI